MLKSKNVVIPEGLSIPVIKIFLQEQIERLEEKEGEYEEKAEDCRNRRSAIEGALDELRDAEE